MRIRIREVIPRRDCCLVRFSSLYGNASGHWQGAAPQAEQSYEVEIDLPSLDSPDAHIQRFDGADARPSLGEEGGAVILIGGHIAGPSSGAGALQLGDDCVLLQGIPPACEGATLVRIEARYILLYPFGV